MTSRVSADALAFAGGAAGMIEAVAVQPLEIIKVRFQLNVGRNSTISKALQSLIREGGVPRLYRGLLPELVGMFPTRSAMYSSQELFRRELMKLTPHGQETAVVAGCAGAMAGVPEAAATTPFQFAKVRLQSKVHLHRYSGTVDCITKVLKEEGPRAFGTGFASTCVRNSVWNGVYFFTMFHIRKVISEPESRLLGTAQTLAVGFFGGVTATAFNAPFDVIKSRIQGQGPIPEWPSVRCMSVGGTLVSIAQREGFLALYKGFAPKALRMGMGGGVAIASFEAICRVIDRYGAYG